MIPRGCLPAAVSRVAMVLLISSLGGPVIAGAPAAEFTLKFPEEAAASLGQIDKLVVKVSCGRILRLEDIPELYNIEMGYEIPTENVLSAWPRLGAAAVLLSRWSGVVHLRADVDGAACFAVMVEAEGRSGLTRQWDGRQLGLAK